MKDLRNRSLVVLLMLTAFITSRGQTIVKGVIKDASTGQPLQSVSVYFRGGKGVTSAADGSYTLATENSRLSVVQFSYVGYKTASKTVRPNHEQVIDVSLEVSDTKRNVTVKTNRRGRYTNKD